MQRLDTGMTKLWLTSFFFLCFLLTLSAIVRPDLAVDWTIKYYKWTLNLIGLEAEIRSTKKALTLCRVWNIFMFLVFAGAFAAVLTAYFRKSKF